MVAPDHWTSSGTPLIEKDNADKPYLTRLRVDHLFEPDYLLFLNCFMAKECFCNGKGGQALNFQQHGSGP